MGSKSNACPKPDLTKALKPTGGVPKVGDCHYCKKPGHWKKNCHAYLEDLKKKKAVVTTSDPGIYVIEVNLSTSTSWVLDTGYGSHICIMCRNFRKVGHWRREKSTYELTMEQRLLL